MNLTTESRPFAEVILCTFNSESTIEACVKSVITNLNKDLRLYIIDDHSTDTTLQLIYKLAQPHMSYITIQANDSNVGLTENLANYLKLNRAKYTFRMDADDVCAPNRFTTQLAYLAANQNVDILGTQAFLIRDSQFTIAGLSNKPITPKSIRARSYANPLIHSSIVFRTSAILSIGNYNVRYRYGQDYELWFRAIKANLVIHNLDIPLLYLRTSCRTKYSLDTYYDELIIGFRGASSCRLGITAYIMIILRYLRALAAHFFNL